MGKKCNSETKKIKKGNNAETIKIRNMRSFEYKRVPQRKIVLKGSKKYNILDTLNSYISPSITELIKSLDDKVIPDTKSDFYLKFSSNLTEREFIKLFKEGINFAKKNFKYDNLKILKEILLLLKDINGINSTDEFGLEKCKDNKLQKVFKFDLILSLLSDQSKLEELEIKDANDVNEIRTAFINSIDYGLFKSYNEMENAIPFNQNSNGVYSYQSLKNIIFSQTIISLYKDVLYELYDIKISKKELIKVVEEFINTHNIFFVKMSLQRFGMLLYDGTIFVNSAYYSQTYSKQDAFVIYYTILHEIMHAISRILRKNDNYLLNTNEFTKSRKIKSKESGDYFENKFLINIIKKKELSVFEANYLVDANNYNYENIEDFHSAFVNWRKKNMNAINNSQTFIISKPSGQATFSIKIGCYCNGARKSD